MRKKSDERIKYFIVFVSGHSDAMLLMNDFMYNAYFSNMHKADYGGTLFGDLDWRDMPLPEENSLGKLKAAILDIVRRNPGEIRRSIWFQIVKTDFMKYSHSRYLEALKLLSKEGKIDYQVDPQTNRRNDSSKLFSRA